MTGVQFVVTIPASIVNVLIKKGVTELTMGATELDVNSSDAKPMIVNAAYPPISYGPISLYESTGAVFPLPQYPITIGTWTAERKGKMVFITGRATVVLTAPKLTVKVECKPSPHVTLSTTTVS